MIVRTLRNLVIEEDGMEMVEWAVVGIVFALTAAGFWSALGGNINTALQAIGTCVSTGTC